MPGGVLVCVVALHPTSSCFMQCKEETFQKGGWVVGSRKNILQSTAQKTGSVAVDGLTTMHNIRTTNGAQRKPARTAQVCE
uniref:Putative secreted protein n=1 Tax=Anopheles marajoara TaxID=58244 RepID=A0A2M4CBU5_9DIPT